MRTLSVPCSLVSILRTALSSCAPRNLVSAADGSSRSMLLARPRGIAGVAMAVVFSILCVSVSVANAWAQAGQTISVDNGDVAGLISAIQTLNANGGGTIDLASSGTYSVTAPSDWWFGPNAFPAISSAIVINGNGATISRASGSPKFRFFYVSGGFTTLPAGSLTLNNLTLSGGLAQGGTGGADGNSTGGGGAGLGGAIYNQGVTSLENATLTGNTAQGGASPGTCTLFEPPSPSCEGEIGGAGGGWAVTAEAGAVEVGAFVITAQPQPRVHPAAIARRAEDSWDRRAAWPIRMPPTVRP